MIVEKVMRKLTQEQKQMMDRAIKFAPARQILMWAWCGGKMNENGKISTN